VGTCPECKVPVRLIHEGKNGHPAHFAHKSQTESQRVPCSLAEGERRASR
jgi:competence CoiA-like predicted nuclease